MVTDVTVVSAFHNREDQVDLSVSSLLDQTFPHFRAVIVDDGSTDATFDRLFRFAGGRIEVRRQANQGFTRTIAELCREADTEFIALHGAGDESLPRRMEAQRAFLIEHPSVVAVGCGIRNVDEVNGRSWDVMPDAPIKRGPILSGFRISHGEVMFRRDAYLRAGGYREMFRVGQATDLFRRLSRLGDFGYVPEVLYRRRLLPSGVNAQLDKLAQREILAAMSSVVHRRAVGEGRAASGTLRDDIDAMGALFPYLSAPSAEIAVALARAAKLYWMNGDREVALRLARRSLNEKFTRTGALTYSAILTGAGALAPLMTRLVLGRDRDTSEISLKRLKEAADSRPSEGALSVQTRPRTLRPQS